MSDSVSQSYTDCSCSESPENFSFSTTQTLLQSQQTPRIPHNTSHFYWDWPHLLIELLRLKHDMRLWRWHTLSVLSCSRSTWLTVYSQLCWGQRPPARPPTIRDTTQTRIHQSCPSTGTWPVCISNPLGRIYVEQRGTAFVFTALSQFYVGGNNITFSGIC